MYMYIVIENYYYYAAISNLIESMYIIIVYMQSNDIKSLKSFNKQGKF